MGEFNGEDEKSWSVGIAGVAFFVCAVWGFYASRLHIARAIRATASEFQGFGLDLLRQALAAIGLN